MVNDIIKNLRQGGGFLLCHCNNQRLLLDYFHKTTIRAILQAEDIDPSCNF